MWLNNTLSDKLENANYYVFRTHFNLPKFISYEHILSQYNLVSFKHRRCVQALTLKVYMTQNFFLLYFAVLYIQKPILNLKLL